MVPRLPFLERWRTVKRRPLQPPPCPPLYMDIMHVKLFNPEYYVHTYGGCHACVLKLLINPTMIVIGATCQPCSWSLKV